MPLLALRPSACLQFMPHLASAGRVRASCRPPLAALLCPTAPPQMLAARMRPESLPAYEVLYKTAEEIAAKREELRRAAEAAKLKVGRGEWETAHCAGSLRAGRWLEDVRPLDPCWRIPAAKPNASPIRYSASQECLFHPVMVAEPKAKEGRALKLVAELTQVGSGVPPEQEEGRPRCHLLVCLPFRPCSTACCCLRHPAAAVQAHHDRGRGSG